MMPIFTFSFFGPDFPTDFAADFVERFAAFAIFSPPLPVRLPNAQRARVYGPPASWYRGKKARSNLPLAIPVSISVYFRAWSPGTGQSPWSRAAANARS